jgi:hypothetical protein
MQGARYFFNYGERNGSIFFNHGGSLSPDIYRDHGVTLFYIVNRQILNIGWIFFKK